MTGGVSNVVTVCNRIRRDFDDRDGFDEFCWFAREYPLCYLFHLEGAEFRLKSIHSLLTSVRSGLVERLSASGDEAFELGFGDADIRVQQVYWDFESLLSEISISLDLLARVVGPAFKEHSPPSFSKLCKWPVSHPLLDLFRTVDGRWVHRLKDYRDCFTHYTPVDTLLALVLRRYPNGWELRAKLPTNPNIREILGFRFSRRVELLHYAVAVYKHLVAFDRALAQILWKLYRAEQFPIRIHGLLFRGQRQRAQSP